MSIYLSIYLYIYIYTRVLPSIYIDEDVLFAPASGCLCRSFGLALLERRYVGADDSVNLQKFWIGFVGTAFKATGFGCADGRPEAIERFC